MTEPYRPNPLQFPMDERGVERLDQTIDDIYSELRRLSALAATTETTSGGGAASGTAQAQLLARVYLRG